MPVHALQRVGGPVVRIGWIGLGNMGGPMAANLVRAGHVVNGYDVSGTALATATRNGVAVQDSIAATVTDADFVFTMLPTGVHARDVILGDSGVFASAPTTAVVVDSSTIDMATARELHGAARESGFSFLDAPVSGGVSGAAAGTLTFMVGGDADVLEATTPVLDVLAGKIVHCGGPANGQAAKIVNNMMLAICLGTAHLVPGARRGRERRGEPRFRRRLLHSAAAQGRRSRPGGRQRHGHRPELRSRRRRPPRFPRRQGMGGSGLFHPGEVDPGLLHRLTRLTHNNRREFDDE
jgi:hypothetical protein